MSLRLVPLSMMDREGKFTVKTIYGDVLTVRHVDWTGVAVQIYLTLNVTDVVDQLTDESKVKLVALANAVKEMSTGFRVKNPALIEYSDRPGLIQIS